MPPDCEMSSQLLLLLPFQSNFFFLQTFCSFYQHVLLATLATAVLLPTCAHLCSSINTGTQTCCIFVTSDLDEVRSNSHLSEAVDRLATGGNWIWCDRVLSGLWELDIESCSPKPYAHQLLSTRSAFLVIPADLSEEQGRITHCNIKKMWYSYRYHLRNMR